MNDEDYTWDLIDVLAMEGNGEFFKCSAANAVHNP